MNRTFRLTSIIIATLLFGAGCSLFGGRGQSTTDGGVFQSGDYGTSWQSASFIGVANNREISLKNDNIAQLLFHPTDAATLYAVTTGGKIFRTVNSGGQWTDVNPTISGIQRLAINPGTPEILYASRGGDILKTEDSGVNWETIYIESVATQGVTALLVDPADTSIVYAATNTGALNVSTDAGKTWARRSSIDREIQKLLMSPQDRSVLFALTTTSGLWRSTDSGNTWEDISQPLKAIDRRAYAINDVAIKPTDQSTLVAGTTYGLMSTHDSGSTWEVVPTVLEENKVPIQTVALDPEGKPIIYFSVENKVHRSTDNGANWSISQLPTGRMVSQLLIDPTNSAVLYAGVQPLPKK